MELPDWGPMDLDEATRCPECDQRFYSRQLLYPDCVTVERIRHYSGCPKCYDYLMKHFRGLFNRIHSLEGLVVDKVKQIQTYVAKQTFLKFNPNVDLSDKSIKAGDIVKIYVNGDDNPILAHRFILASRSPAFRLLFENQTNVTECTELRIRSTTRSVMQAVIDFFYHADLKFNQNFYVTLEEVLLVAHRYEITYLVEVYDEELAVRVNNENVLSMLKLANMFRLPKISKAVSEVVRHNFDRYFPVIMAEYK